MLDRIDSPNAYHYGHLFKDLLNHGWSVEAVAEKFGKPVDHILAVLEIQEMPMFAQRMVSDGLVSYFTVLEAFRASQGDPKRMIDTLLAQHPNFSAIIKELNQPTTLSKRRISVYINDCLRVLSQLKRQRIFFDAIITDPPYEIGLHGKQWDRTGISFSPQLWNALFAILKPGGFIAAFSAGRLYHHLAVAAENAGFTLYPFLSWTFGLGVPKPANVSELFDRVNLADREVLGFRPGSGYTKANADQGRQNRHTTKFPIYERYVSNEAKQWRGYYYGLTCMLPNREPILLAQKPIDQRRTIDNLRVWGTGALNIGALHARYGSWPSLDLEHERQRGDHGSEHPSVKPVKLMEDLCLLLCPTNGSIIDPFAGTGTTGLAAQRSGFGCTLIEREEPMREVIKRRLGACAINLEICG